MERRGAISFLNEWGADILTSVHHFWGHSRKLVRLLTEYASVIKSAVRMFPLERTELLEKLEAAERRVNACFASKCLSTPEKVMSVLVTSSSEDDDTTYDNPLVHAAEALQCGPIQLALSHDLTCVVGSKQVSKLIWKVFWGSLKTRSSKRPHEILSLSFGKHAPPFWDLLLGCYDACRSPRYSPAVMFFLEGLSKGFLLALVASVSIFYYREHSDILNSERNSSLIGFLVLMWLASLLYFFGHLSHFRSAIVRRLVSLTIRRFPS